MEKSKGEAPPSQEEGTSKGAGGQAKQQIPWARIAGGLLLGGFGLGYVLRQAGLAEVQAALEQASLLYVLLGLLLNGLTMVVKAWRWRRLYRPLNQAPPLPDLFWALSLGQMVNSAVPFVRLGEVARIYELGQQTHSSRARALGTLVVEKVLDMLVLALILFLLLPFLVLPSFVADSGLALALLATLATVFLFVVAYHTELVLRLAQVVLRRFPERLSRRLAPLAVSGLEGLAALRDPGASLRLLFDSALIAALSILIPLLLFPAFDLPLNLAAAATIHLAITVGSLPPSTPVKVGVFEFLVVFMLNRFFPTVQEGVLLAYALLFHLIVLLPQLVLGGIALARNKQRGGR